MKTRSEFLRDTIGTGLAIGIVVACIGCASTSSRSVDLETTQLVGQWDLVHDDLSGSITLDEDGTISGHDWPPVALCSNSVAQDATIPSITGKWLGGDGSPTVNLYLDAPCSVQRLGFAEETDEGELELWFFEPEADLDGLPDPQWILRRS